MRRYQTVGLVLLLGACQANAQVLPSLEELMTAQHRWRVDTGIAYFNQQSSGAVATGPIYIQIGQQFIPIATGILPRSRNVDSIVGYAGLRYGFSADTELSFSTAGSYSNERTLLEGRAASSESSFNYSTLSLTASHRFFGRLCMGNRNRLHRCGNCGNGSHFSDMGRRCCHVWWGLDGGCSNANLGSDPDFLLYFRRALQIGYGI